MMGRLATIVFLAGAACSKNRGLVVDGGASDRGVERNGDVAMAETSVDRTSSADRPSPPPDSQSSRPPGLLFPDAPTVACGAESACDYPMPQCAYLACANGGQSCGAPALWMVFYENPRCVGGSCAWDARYYECGPDSRCSNGTCVANFTIP